MFDRNTDALVLLAFAFVVAIVLVGGAFWLRVTFGPPTRADRIEQLERQVEQLQQGDMTDD